MKGRTTHSLRTPALATLCPILLLCTCPLSPAQERDGAAFVGDEITSLESIRGKSFKSLELMATRALSDISPVRGMKLEKVNLWKTKVTDLSPLNGMPIRELTICGGGVKDLNPLAGMPLEEVWIGEVPVKDISPLKDLPLKHLYLHCPKIDDISILRRMPLETLSLSDTGVSNLSPLEGAPLETFYARRNVVTRNQKLLRAMKHLDTVRCPDGNGWFDQIDLNPEDNGQEIDPFASPKESHGSNVLHLPDVDPGSSPKIAVE